MSAPRHAPRVPFAILVIGLAAGGLVLLLVLNTFSAANELRRHDLASRAASIGAQLQQLQNEVADSAAPANLAAAALALGMVPAGNPAFLVIGRDGTVRVLGSAAPATPAIVDVARPPAAPKTSSDAKSPKDDNKKDDTQKDDRQKNTKTAKHDPAKHSGDQHGTNDKSKNKTKKQDDKTQRSTPTPTPTPTLSLPGGDR